MQTQNKYTELYLKSAPSLSLIEKKRQPIQAEQKQQKEDQQEDPQDTPSQPQQQDTPHNQEQDNWTGENLITISQWIQISSLQIEILDLAIKYFRSIVRRNVLLGLIFSTASGSISIFQLNTQSQQIFLNIMFTILSFSIAIFTGLIKIYQVQERLEEFIQTKQEWIGFSVVITAEVQLPVNERRKAMEIIKSNKNKYLDLLKIDLDIPNFIKSLAYKNLYHDDEHKKMYLTNCKIHKQLKELDDCQDNHYFEEQYDKYKKSITNNEDTELLSSTKQNSTNRTSMKWIIEPVITITDKTIISMDKIYKYVINHKNKYIGEKTALSNIILTVILEEENKQRTKQIKQLLNQIEERYNKLNKTPSQSPTTTISEACEKV